MQTGVAALSPGTPPVQLAAFDQLPLMGALQLLHGPEEALADAAVGAVGTAKQPRVSVPTNKKRQRVMSSSPDAAAYPAE